MNNLENTFNQIKGKLKGVRESGINKFKACCPAHDDKNASLSVNLSGDYILMKCFAGCEFENIANALGYETRELSVKNNNNIRSNTASSEIIYTYTDENGKYLYEKVRNDQKGLKGVFRRNIDGKIFWGMKKGRYYETFSGSNHYSRNEKHKGNLYIDIETNISKTLYNLPALLKAIEEGKQVYIFEGEKDVETGKKLGIIGTTNPDGAGRNKFKKSYARYFKNADVIIVPDCDKAGEEHSDSILNIIKDVVKSVKIIKLPNEKEVKGYDFTNYIEEGNTEEEFKKLVEETKIINLESEEKEKTPEPNKAVQELNSCYIKARPNGSLEVISNFIITLNEEIRHPAGSYITATFKNIKGIEMQKTFLLKDFSNKHKFLEIIDSIDFSFTGSDKDLQHIKNILAEQDRTIKTGVSHVGFHEIDGEEYFITDKRAVNKQLEEVDNIVYMGNVSSNLTTDILEVDPITSDELKEITPHLFRFNTLENTSSILLCLIAQMLKSKLFKLGYNAPHLLIYGEAGAGKTQTVRNIINPLISSDFTLNAQNITKFSAISIIASSDSIPVMIDEYKPSLMSIRENDLISSILRNAYDRALAPRGTATQQLNEYPLLAPLILIGEEGQEETAVIERSIIIQLSKTESKEHEESFKFLKERKHLISKLGRSILNEIIKIDDVEIKKAMKSLANTDISIKESRLKESYFVMTLAYAVLEKVFQHNNINIKETGFKSNNITSALRNNIDGEMLDECGCVKSAITQTLEIYNKLIYHGFIEIDRDITFRKNKTEIAIDVKNTFDSVTRFKRDFNVSGFILTKEDTFTKQLRKQKYFTKYEVVSFAGDRKRAYILDVEKLREEGIEFTNLFSH